jgi:hypothetical protein
MREKVMLVGDSNTSKTFSLISLAMLYPSSKVIIFDPDDGSSKTLDELGLTPNDLPNLMIIPVRADWGEFKTAYDIVKPTLTEKDWMCFDMLGRFWDLAQQYYAQQVFGKNPVEHLLSLKKQAQSTQFNGFDGLQDWPLIKRIYGELFIDDAVVYSKFNVMATCGVKEFLPVERVPKTGIQSLYALRFGIKPDGEKHNVYRFDTQAVLYRKKEGGYFFKLVRDRGRQVQDTEFEITGKNFWNVYAEYRGIKL